MKDLSIIWLSSKQSLQKVELEWYAVYIAGKKLIFQDEFKTVSNCFA